MFALLHEFMGFGVSKGSKIGFCSLLLLFLPKTKVVVGSLQGGQCVCGHDVCVVVFLHAPLLLSGMYYF